MIPREDIHAALSTANGKAWLRLVRERESSQTDRAYYMVNGKPDLTSLSMHPYVGVPTTMGARASGAYQFLGTTWGGLANQYPLDARDFSPAAQDFMCLALTAEAGALPDVLSGNIVEAMRKCHGKWTSLPGGSENTGYTVNHALDVFRKYGGVPTGEQPTAPIEEIVIPSQPQGETDMGAGLLMALVQSVISGFAPLAQQKMSDALAKHGGDPTAAGAIMNGVLSAVASAAGTSPQVLQSDPKAAIAAVNTVQNDSAKLQQVEQDSLASLDKLAPVLDKLHQYSKDEWAAEEASRDAGSARAQIDGTPDQDRLITVSLISLVMLIIVALGAGMGMLIVYDRPYGEFLSLFSGAVGVILGKYGTRVDYRYGSSRSSAGKDETIKQMSKVTK
jgi:muramidase (phage lysozyme)